MMNHKNAYFLDACVKTCVQEIAQCESRTCAKICTPAANCVAKTCQGVYADVSAKICADVCANIKAKVDVTG